jgi:hypothetical protein
MSPTTIRCDLEQDGVTEVEWRLAPVATLTGRAASRCRAWQSAAGHNDHYRVRPVRQQCPQPIYQDGCRGRYRLRGIPSCQTIVHAFSDQHAPGMTKLTAAVSVAADANFELVPGQPVTARVKHSADAIAEFTGRHTVTDAESHSRCRSFRT